MQEPAKNKGWRVRSLACGSIQADNRTAAQSLGTRPWVTRSGLFPAESERDTHCGWSAQRCRERGNAQGPSKAGEEHPYEETDRAAWSVVDGRCVFRNA